MKFEISIIILVWEKEYETNLLLKSLTLQDFDKEKFEVIIVDDGSKSPLDSIINKYNNLNIKYIRNKHTGNRAENRNCGIKKSEGDILIFLDGDMIPGKNMIKDFYESVKGDTKKICLGIRNKTLKFQRKILNEAVLENSFEILENLPAIKDERTYIMEYCEKNNITNNEWIWQMFYSHSICLWKKEYESVGGFDKDFNKYWGAEDVELGYRLFKSGCKIIINNKIILYHLYHPEDMLDKENELQINYKIFLKKHPNWMVELFIKEKELNPESKIDLIKKIKANKYITSKINTEQLIQTIPENTILFGIENRKVLNSVKIKKAFIPINKLKSDKIINLIGIQTEYKNKQFECAVISKKYKNLNDGVFHMIIQEADRIAKKIIITDEIKTRKETKYIKNIINPSNYILFQLSGYSNNYIRNYYYNLAIAADEAGINTGIYFPWYSDKNKNKYFLNIESEEKKNIIHKLTKKNLDTIGYKIPNILDPYLSEYNVFPEKNRIIWSDENYSSLNKTPFKHIFLTSKQDSIHVKNTHNYDLLKIGIDHKKIETIRNENIKPNSDFTFLYIDFSVSNLSNILLLTETFQELFNNRQNIYLKILSSFNLYYFKSAFFTESYHNIINHNIKSQNQTYRNNINILIDKLKYSKNIIFQNNILNDEDLTREINKDNCLIQLSSSNSISPFTLESIALGKKPIIQYSNKYKDYFNQGLCFNLNNENQDTTNIKIYKDVLKNQMMYAYTNQDSILINEINRRDFINNNSWINRAETLKVLLKQLF